MDENLRGPIILLFFSLGLRKIKAGNHGKQEDIPTDNSPSSWLCQCLCRLSSS